MRPLSNMCFSMRCADKTHVWVLLTAFHPSLMRSFASSSRAAPWFQAVGCLQSLLLSQVGVQRAKPIDLSAGNEPFHINGGRGGQNAGQVLLFMCGCPLSAAQAHVATLRSPSHYTGDNYLTVNVTCRSTYWMEGH